VPLRRASDAVRRPPPAPKQRRRLPARGLGLAALAILVAAAVAIGLWVRPWVVGPPADEATIEARWSQVEGWATAGAGSGASPRLLKEALAALEPVRGLVKTSLREEDPELLEPPPADLTRALALLADWAEQGGGLGEDPCLGGVRSSLSPLEVMTLGQVAMAVATGAGDPRWAAALRLADQLRERGNMLHLAVGFALAERALETAQERGYPPEALRTHRPEVEQLFPAAAREAVCVHEEVARELAGGRGPALPGQPWRERLGSVERELEMLRWWHGERLVAAHPARADLSALASSLDVEPEELPASAVVRLVAPYPLPALVRDAEETIARYDRVTTRP